MTVPVVTFEFVLPVDTVGPMTSNSSSCWKAGRL